MAHLHNQAYLDSLTLEQLREKWEHTFEQPRTDFASAQTLAYRHQYKQELDRRNGKKETP